MIGCCGAACEETLFWSVVVASGCMSTMLLLELFIFYAMDGCGAVSNTAAKQRSGKGRSLIVLFMQSFA